MFNLQPPRHISTLPQSDNDLGAQSSLPARLSEHVLNRRFGQIPNQPLNPWRQRSGAG